VSLAKSVRNIRVSESDTESKKHTQRWILGGCQQEGADDIYLGYYVPVVSCELPPWAVVYALILRMHGAGLTKEADCALCSPGKYQTGVGLMAESNCTWCVAGKYQSGSGLSAALLFSFRRQLRLKVTR
jgi:hypothetical protein